MNVQPFSMPRASGIIMAAVAVLLIHMGEGGRDGEEHDGSPAQVSLGELHHLAGDLGVESLLREAAARAKPPKKRNRTGLAKSVSDLLHVEHP